MLEAHIMIKKDEVPIVTLILLHSRIILLIDWLIKLKDFILLNTTVIQPSKLYIQKLQYSVF